jgi:hypothetical protein
VTIFRGTPPWLRSNRLKNRFAAARVVKKLMRPPDDNISAGHPNVLDYELSDYCTDSNSWRG